jgi:GNAT superfamily N-acetyltransferase
MPDSVAIRTANASDIAALLELVREYWAFEGVPGFDPERCARALRLLFGRPNLGTCWIAEHDGVAVGYLLACFVFSLEHGGLTAEIDELFVRKESRGAAIGGRLLSTAGTVLREAGCTSVALQLGRGNDVARAFYHRHGYTEREGYELLDKTLETRSDDD